MFRKSIIAIVAVATIAAVALPSAASAKRGKGGKYFRSFATVTVVGTGLAATSCYKYRWIETRAGLRKVLVNVCRYY